MSQYNKAKGSKFESDIEEYLNLLGIKARRLPRAGSKDIGDVAITLETVPVAIVLEAKNVKTPDMAGWLKEAEIEAGNYDERYNIAALGMVVQKARGKGIRHARVTLTLESLADLLKWSQLA